MPKKNSGDQGGNEPDTGDGVDWEAEAKKFKALARKHEDRAKTHHAELEQLKSGSSGSDSDKSDMDKLRESIALLTERAEKAELDALKATVAAEKKLTPRQARRLQGSTRDELEDDADEMIADFGIKADGDDDKSDKDDDAKAKVNGNGKGDGKSDGQRWRPKEKLRPGTPPSDGGGDGDDSFDPDKTADKILDF